MFGPILVIGQVPRLSRAYGRSDLLGAFSKMTNFFKTTVFRSEELTILTRPLTEAWEFTPGWCSKVNCYEALKRNPCCCSWVDCGTLKNVQVGVAGWTVGH